MMGDGKRLAMIVYIVSVVAWCSLDIINGSEGAPRGL